MLEHGGNLTAASRQYGIPLEAWLDLSTGINPNGYPLSLIPPSAWQRLPLHDDGLVEAAQKYYGCPHALPTSGSQAALQTLPRLRAPCRVAVLTRTYSEHRLAWSRCGHEIVTYADKPDAQILSQADVVLVCNPNNPTAMRYTPAELLQWHEQLAQRGGWLIVDEAFMDATPESSIARYADRPGLFVLRSLGKFFGLAGARVGFLLAAKATLHAVEELLGPWPLSGPSRLVAVQALTDKAWQEQALKQLRTDSLQLSSLLSKHGLAPQAGTDLFQWVPTAKAAAWHRHFARHGIWVRHFDEFAALRFGLPPVDGWARLSAALQAFSD